MAEQRRLCNGCGKNRAERFFASHRAHKCSYCIRKRVSLANRDARLMDTYGISEAEYQDMLALQDGRCAICLCRRSYNLDVDHDHTKVADGSSVRMSVRGLLCKTCNRRLLRACRDDTRILQRAIEYLTNPPAQLSPPPHHA